MRVELRSKVKVYIIARDHLFRIVQFAGAVECQHASEQLGISVKEVLVQLVVVEVFFLVWTEQSVRVLVERVSPGLEAMSADVDAHADISTHQCVGATTDGGRRDRTVSDRNPTDGRRSDER